MSNMMGADTGLGERGAVTRAAGFALLLIAVSFGDARAADDTSGSILEEVTVTARYTRENLQQTPIAITALDAEQLAQRGANSIVDVAAEAPNVTLMTGGSTYGKSAQAFIRGVGQINFNFAFEPAVGFYVDGVYHGTVFGSLFDLDDVDRIEVLRGPQGTLFGKSNEGGAILISTVKPTGQDTGYIEVGYGNYGHERLKAAAPITLVDGKLFLRISGGMDNSDGWFTRYDYTCLHPATAGSLPALTGNPNCKLGTEGGSRVNTGRIALRYVPTDSLEIVLRGDLMDDRSEADPTKLLAVNNAPGTGINDYNNNVAIPLFGVPLDSRFLTNSPYTSYATYREPSTGRQIPPISTNYASGYSATVDWDAPFGIHVKNIMAFRHLDGAFAINGTESPIPDFIILQSPFHRQYTEELNISGHLFGAKLDWTVGAFYYNALSVEGGYPQLLPGLEIVPPQGAGSPFAPDGYYGLDFISTDPIRDKDTSGFVHGVFHATDKFSIEAGVRYTSQSKTYTFQRTALATNPPDPLFPAGQPVAGLYNVSATAPTDRVDPKLALQYQWTPTLMTYLQLATGYKGAGINSQPVFASDVTPFGAEKLTSVEAGLKGQWFENRLRINTAIFHSDYEDLQQNSYTANGSNQTINTGRMHIDGLEVETSAVPAPGLLVNAGLGYLHFKTTDLGLAGNAPPAFAPTLSTVPPYVPKLKYNLGVQYSLRVANFGAVTPRLDWSYQTKVYNDVANSPETLQPAYGLLNGRIAFEPTAGQWQFAVEARNLLNKVYYVNMANFLPSYGTLDAQPGPPRMILGTVRRNF